MKNYCQKNKNSGFTLIELLVVIAVLGVLAAGVFTAINPMQKLQAARNAQRKMDLGTLTNALEAYAISHNGQYPIGGWCGPVGSWWDCGPDWIPGLVASGELKTLPKDPRTGQTFPPCSDGRSVGYLYLSNGTDYKILAHCGLEGPAPSPSDPFYDPTRPSYTWQRSTPGGLNW